SSSSASNAAQMSSRNVSNQAFARALRSSIAERSIMRFPKNARVIASKAKQSIVSQKEWIASSLTLLATKVKVTLTLRAVIGAGLAAAIAEDADARNGAGVLNAIPDEAGQVL